MAIKAIQLRGISRTPSDRMTQDGGLAESLNLFVDDSETATMPTPEDVTETAEDGYGHKLFPSDTTTVPENPEQWEAVFIHKSPYFTRAIVKYEGEHHEEETYVAGMPVNTIYDEFGDDEEEAQEEPTIVTKLGWVNDGVVVELMEIADGDEFVKCSAFGNTLGVVTEKTIFWFVVKGGNYIALGNLLPFPKFTLASKKTTDTSGVEEICQFREPITEPDYYISEGSTTFKSILQNARPLSEIVDYSTPLNNRNFFTQVKNYIKNKASSKASSGEFVYQRFAILAVELSDGTSLISSPILLGVGFPVLLNYAFVGSISLIEWSNQGEGILHVDDLKSKHIVEGVLKGAYKPWIKLEEDKDFFDNWGDIVKKVKLYMSTNIHPAEDIMYAKIPSFDIEYESGANLTINRNHIDLSSYPECAGNTAINLEFKRNEEVELLSKSQFYLVASFDLENAEDVKQLFAGKLLDLSSTKTTGNTTVSVMTDELLIAQPALDFSKSDMKHYGVYFRNGQSYNNSLIITGISDMVAIDLPCLTTTRYYGGSKDGINIDGITFHIQEASGKWHAVEATFNGNVDPCAQKTTIDGQQYNNMQYGFVICPDARCKYAIVSFYNTPLDEHSTLRLDFKDHPNLDCSYWYGGAEKKINSFETTMEEYVAGNRSETIVVPNKIYASELDNPFFFPIDSRYTFTGKVLGVAIATTALSTGQFGQYPLYVFTDDGIWLLETGSDGSFVTSKPGPREVCINPDSITPIDNAVVFVTEKAVMMISGSQVTNISPNMNGQHFHLNPESAEAQLIAGSDWAEILDGIEDDTHFMAFMREAFIVYDYAGERLVFFKEDEVYQYVYYLRSATWHKMARPIAIPAVSGETQVETDETDETDETVETPGGQDSSEAQPESQEETLSYRYPLSDYPYSYVNVVGENSTRILKISTRKDVTSSARVPGVIITRPIELGLADVRKVIKDIRIRGVYDKNYVKYILLGSFDGLSWTVLRSLRGGSYKLFRMIILTNLAPNERISWIDIDYDERYNDKLR